MPRYRLLLVLLICFTALPLPGLSQTGTEQPMPNFDELEQDLDWVQWLLENSRTNQVQLERIRSRVQSVVENARTAAPRANEKVNSLRKQVDALGKAPETDSGQQESTDIASKRAELQDKLATSEGYLRRIELIETRGKELLERVAEEESKATAKVILSRDSTVFDAGIWRDAAEQARNIPLKLVQLGIATISQRDLGYYAYIAAAILGLMLLLRLLLLRLVSPADTADKGRFIPALIALTANGFLPAAGLVAAGIPLLGTGEIQAPQARLVEAIMAAGAALLIARAWIHIALFSIETPRLVKLDEDLATPLARLLYVLTGVVILSFFLYQMGRARIAEPEFYRSAQLVLRISIAVAFLYMLPLFRSAMQRAHEAQGGSSARVIQGMYGTLFFVARIVVPAIIVSNPLLIAFGYWRLSDWLFIGVIGSCLLLLTLWLIRNAFREAVSNSLAGIQPDPTPGSPRQPTPAGSMMIWGIGLSNLTLWLGAIVCLFLIWGVPPSQIRTWGNAFLFTKISISRVEISAADILAAFVVFFVLLMLTRLIQRQLQKRVLSWAPLDIGVRNALWSAVGYIGILVAFTASLMALGINLSQLFLIIGALSVGIGFGLQSIVHDFISGLILLFERPVRIGDWITVDGEEGKVQRIGARVSLLKTGVDGDIWIPNSKLTSSQVTNWTLSSHAGHIRVASPLHIDTDEKQAREIMLRVANDHSSVVRPPEPAIYMEGVNGDAFTLVLHAVVQNIADRFSVESDLRFSLKAAFREAGIQYAEQPEDDSTVAARADTIPGRYVLGRE